jgi:hypothetical protein
VIGLFAISLSFALPLCAQGGQDDPLLKTLVRLERPTESEYRMPELGVRVPEPLPAHRVHAVLETLHVPVYRCCEPVETFTLTPSKPILRSNPTLAWVQLYERGHGSWNSNPSRSHWYLDGTRSLSTRLMLEVRNLKPDHNYLVDFRVGSADPAQLLICRELSCRSSRDGTVVNPVDGHVLSVFTTRDGRYEFVKVGMPETGGYIYIFDIVVSEIGPVRSGS